MPGPSPSRCSFPVDFLQEALDTVRRRTVAIQFVQRFRLVLALHEEDRLCVPKDDVKAREPHIICSLGISNG